MQSVKELRQMLNKIAHSPEIEQLSANLKSIGMLRASFQPVRPLIAAKLPRYEPDSH